MDLWWTALTGVEQFFWVIALIFSLFFVIQTALVLLGAGDHDGDSDACGHDEMATDHDFDSADHGFTAAFNPFTVKNFITFFTGFGWAGIAGTRSGFSNVVAVFVALLVGVVLMLIVAYLMYLLSKLSQSGNMQIKNAIGSVGTVYLPIAADRKKAGMIQISIQGSTRELSAFTDEKETLKTGTKIKAIQVIDKQTVMVEKA